MGSNYKWTCPQIDRAIDAIRGQLGDSIYNMIENHIEEIRDTNSDIRDAANKQIDDLEDEYINQIEALKEEIQQLIDYNHKLENQ